MTEGCKGKEEAAGAVTAGAEVGSDSLGVEGRIGVDPTSFSKSSVDGLRSVENEIVGRALEAVFRMGITDLAGLEAGWAMTWSKSSSKRSQSSDIINYQCL